MIRNRSIIADEYVVNAHLRSKIVATFEEDEQEEIESLLDLMLTAEKTWVLSRT